MLIATMQPGAARRSAYACGVELWSLKTLSDPQRGLVNIDPRKHERRGDHRWSATRTTRAVIDLAFSGLLP
jgi:hypothetical protein